LTITSSQILIATTWRSGSSFLGDLLQHYPGSFYSFEPIHFQSVAQNENRTVPDMLTPLRLLEDIYECNVEPGFVPYLQHAARGSHQFLFGHNSRVWKICQNLLPLKSACFLPKLYSTVRQRPSKGTEMMTCSFLSQLCSLYPVRTIKTVRLRVAETEALLAGQRELRVIVLVRDPRGVMSSRAGMEWCERPECADPQIHCNNLLADVEAAHNLRQRSRRPINECKRSRFRLV